VYFENIIISILLLVRSISFVKEKLQPCPSYRLIEWNRLSISEIEMLSGLYDEAEVYGIFRPVDKSSNLTLKVAYKEVALLYLHLEHVNVLPRYLYLSDEQKINATIVQLVLDSILEIEYNGNFVSGSAAIKAIFKETLFETTIAPNHLSQLSMEAIQYGLLLRNLDMRSLSYRLYTFNTTPWDAYAKSKFYAGSSVKEFLFSSANNEINNLLNQYWEPDDLFEEKYWLSWLKIAADKNYSIAPNKPTFKLYISPAIYDLPNVFNLVIPVLSASQTLSFKIGNTIHGLLRPDKMIAYFESMKALMQTATSLKKKLTGYAPQGVAFTAQIDETGILSWGVDPALTDVLSTIEAGSWRLKVTDQLALVIMQAQADQLSLPESIHFIKAKLLSVGINTEDWTSVNYTKEFLS
jgi:hypothetical protein